MQLKKALTEIKFLLVVKNNWILIDPVILVITIFRGKDGGRLPHPRVQ